MFGLWQRTRLFLRGIRRPTGVDADMTDEMRFHLEMETERLQRRGLNPEEARRQAAVVFGGVEKYRAAGRDVLGLNWIRGVSLDLTLGFRMLAKYPGLTMVAAFALSLAIGAGAGYLEFVNDLLHGRLPFEEADRIVGIQNWDLQSGKPEHRATADFVRWRGAWRSFEDLGASRSLDRNLITDDGRAEPVRAVEISAAAFRIARVPPLLGRPLVREDENTGAPSVAVIGHDVWISRFASDPAVVGRDIRLGNTAYSIVGVMPAGFGFPVYHSVWMPLRLNDHSSVPREGPALRIFGRLARGVTLEEAQTEVTTLALRTAAEFPDTHQHIRPVVKPYVQSLWSAVEDSEIQTKVFYAANLLFIGLLCVCGANIATLVFARTATRELEISIRTALGASRARIAVQLFAEALVLSSIAAAIGLLVTAYGLQWVKHTVTEAQGMRLWFWWDDSLSPITFGYAATLAIGAALIIGVIPALKATGRNIQERLKHSTGASAAGLRFGRVWTGVIVTQAGLTVIFLAIAGTLTWGRYFSNAGDREVTFPVTQYIATQLNLDSDSFGAASNPAQAGDQFRKRFRVAYDAFAQRLAAEPGIAGVTYASRLPGMNHPEFRIEVPGVSLEGGPDVGLQVRTASVGLGFFETFQARIVAGRSFAAVDLAPGRHVAIVDQTFARRVFGGQNPIGRQFREAANMLRTELIQSDPGADVSRAAPSSRPAGPWVEIIGVIADLTVDTNKKIGDSIVYRPAAAEAVDPFHVTVHVRGDASAIMSRLRTIAAEVNPLLRLRELKTFDQVHGSDRVAIEFFAHLLTGVSAVALVLATAGIYALMSFTVARQTTEIGIRIALGANPRRIVASTFSRGLAQVGLGVLIGSLPASLMVASLAPEVSVQRAVEVAVAACLIPAAFMMLVTALACAVPARRALKIQPADALKVT